MNGATPHYADDRITLHLGDSLNVLPTLPDATIDAVICDPPYGLEFMGKEWDGADGFRRSLNPADVGRDSVFGRTSARAPEYRTAGAGDKRLFQAWCETWARECLRVLKPGGHLLAFGAPRTYHRLACAIEDAGFEIRDSIHWVYGSGFPKSLDVSKAIDRAGGTSPREQAAALRAAREHAGLSREQIATAVGCTPSSVRDWEDGRAREAGRDIEYLVPSPRYRDALAELLGYSPDERVVVGAGGGARGLYETGHRGVQYGEPVTPPARRWEGWGTALKPAHEPIVVARKPLAGTVAANVLEHGTGAMDIDACRTTAGRDYREKCASVVGLDSNRDGDAYGEWAGTREDSAHDAGRWPTNLILCHGPLCVEAGRCQPGCSVAEIDRQSGASRSRVGKPRAAAAGDGWGMTRTGAEYDDAGGSSRFFPIFRYEAKAPASQRPRLADGTAHATVKPLDLMRWLVRLVTPPGGTILDPFAGSGTTGEAAILEGFNAVLIEREPQYADLIAARLSKPLQPSLFGEAA